MGRGGRGREGRRQQGRQCCLGVGVSRAGRTPARRTHQPTHPSVCISSCRSVPSAVRLNRGEARPWGLPPSAGRRDTGSSSCSGSGGGRRHTSGARRCAAVAAGPPSRLCGPRSRLPAGRTSRSSACHSPDPMLSSVGPPWEPEPAPDIEVGATRRKGPAALEHDCMPLPICGVQGSQRGKLLNKKCPVLVLSSATQWVRRRHNPRRESLLPVIASTPWA